MATVGRRRQNNFNLPPRVYLRHGAYYYAHPSGKWERLAKEGDEAEMRRKWAVLEDPAGAHSNISALIDEYLVKHASANKAPRTYKDNLREAEFLRAFFGRMRPQDVLPLHVGQYLDEGVLANRPVRANREKALLSHIFTWAMRHPMWGKMVTFNPCRGQHRNRETKRIRIVEDAEYTAVYKLAHRSVQRLMTMVYRTLQRPSDLIKIGPRNIIMRTIEGEERRVLKIKQGKTGSTVEIIINKDIEDAIARLGNVVYPTFIHTAKGKAYSYAGISAMFRRSMEKHRKEVEEKTGHKPPPFGIYDLKGKGATDMYQSGIPLEQIQQLAGHSSVTTTEIYIKARLIDPVMPNERKITG